jgi:soluble lytic murein transglycosylase-like protein
MRREARRHLIHPVLLVMVVAAESNCKANRVNKRSGAVGLGQILPKGSANRGDYTPLQLRDPDLNLYLTARHIAWCLTLCGDNALAAVAVYNGSKKCRASVWAHRVLDSLSAALFRRRT